MRTHSSLITLVGGIIVMCCFALPWVTFTHGGYKRSWETDVKTGKVGGVQFRSSRPVSEQGTIVKPIPATHHRHYGYKIAFNGNLITVSFVAGILTIVCGFILVAQRTPDKVRSIVLLCSSVGLICLLLAFILMIFTGERGIRSMGNTTYTADGSIQLAAYGTMIGFIIAFIGAMNIPKQSSL